MTWSLVNAPELSEKEFVQWRHMLERRVGIRLGDHQRQFLQSQVSMRMREVGEEDFMRYFNRVVDPQKGGLEWSILLDRLVVKETSFFRHEPSFNFVCAELQDKINNAQLSNTYDLWSLGCSTGEEAYSLAMLVNEGCELAKLNAYFSVTATDVSRVAISLARTAQYPERKLEFVTPAFRYKYFSECGRGQYQFDHELKEKVCFSTANILNDSDMPPLLFDIIFCQNLLVYFQQTLRQKLLDNVVEKLKPGGVLIIGLGEVINWSNPLVDRIARSDVQVYRRKGTSIDGKTRAAHG